MFAGEADFIIADGRIRGRNDGEGREAGAGGLGYDFQRGRVGGGGDDGNAGLDNAGFFAGDFRQGFAKPFLVVQLDVGDDGGERGDDVGGIQATAHAGFPDHEIAVLSGEVLQSHDRHDFKKSGRGALEIAGLEEGAHGCDGLGHFALPTTGDSPGCARQRKPDGAR